MALKKNRKPCSKTDDSMKNHLKPLFIQAKVDETNINKVLVDDGAAVNMMPQSLLKKSLRPTKT